MRPADEILDAPFPPSGDDALIRRVAAGDRVAFRDLYERHGRRVFAFVKGRLHDASESEDILHEVMLEVWRGASRFGGQSRVLTWMLGIAGHKVVDHLRKRRPDLDPDAGIDVADERGGGFEILAARAEASALQTCLGQLPDAMREAVQLVFFQGLRYAEIALVAGCAEGTVKARIHHAKRALRDCLARLGVDPSATGQGA